MDHVVIPIDGDHARAVDMLAAGAAAAAGLPRLAGQRATHVTVLAYTGLPRAAAGPIVVAAVRSVAPFAVHAHGYGFFTGDRDSDLSLHVPVVRTDELSALHAAVFDAVAAAGADVAPWSRPAMWSPHITLLDRVLDHRRLGAAAEWVARRHHPSWTILVDGLALTGGWPEDHAAGDGPTPVLVTFDRGVRHHG